MAKAFFFLICLFKFSTTLSDDLKNLIINEVLFNPIRNGYDYVEGYNKGTGEIDLQQVQIANRNSTGDIASIRVLAKQQTLIAAESFFVITSNERWLRQHYRIPITAVVIALPSLPSFPDDNGTVIFLDKEENILDELAYSANWHFSLLSNSEGVSLERINYYAPTQDKNNWTSASSSSGFGTPGFRNSHFQVSSQIEGEVTISPHIISPNNDGQDDFATIQFNLSATGYAANLVIYDISGRRVRYLLRNELLGTTSKYLWYGEDDKQYPLASGAYILITEMFNLDGRTMKYKHVVVIYRNHS